MKSKPGVKNQPAQHKRIARWLTAFAAATSLGLLLVDLGLAWIFTTSLTQPGCTQDPASLDGAPKPRQVWLETADGLAVRAWRRPWQQSSGISPGV